MVQDKKQNLQPLPEWMWRLRAQWASTLIYQAIRDGISDYLLPASSTWKIRNMRKRFDPSVNNLSQSGPPRSSKGDQGQKGEELRPTTSCYQPLPSQQSIRLLHLHPGAEGSPIEATLSVHSLANLPSYESLSYCWGNKGEFPMVCNSFPITIQQSLFQALRALRLRDVERILWVDAICINQNDNTERSSQVQLMRQIYQCSIRVVVWLGEHAQDSEQGADLLLQIQRLAVENDEKGSDLAQALSSKDLLELGLPSVDSGKWQSLEALLWRPWFTRIWIIQELAVSKEAIVMCADKSFPWADVAHAARFILEHSLTAITQVDPRRPTKSEKFRQAHLTGKGDQPLLPLLLEARDARATNDRDKIFALMGLSERESDGFVPDYSVSIEEVFTAFSKHHIQKTGTLEILGACEDHAYRLKKTLASWVPDWEVHPPALPLYLLDQYASWNASIKIRDEPPTDFDSNTKCLNAKGITVDTVLHTGDSFLEYVPLRDFVPHLRTDQAKRAILSLNDFYMQQRFRQWESIGRKIKRHSAAGNDFLAAFIRTLIADAAIISNSIRISDNSSVSPTLKDFYAAWCKYWSAASQSQGRYISTSYASATAAELEMALAFMQAHHKAAYGRRFFTSKFHSYMGLCPTLTRKGDMLVVLAGGRTSFILRKLRRGRLKFIGECYAHGLMYGEILRQGDSNDTEPRIDEYVII